MATNSKPCKFFTSPVKFRKMDFRGFAMEETIYYIIFIIYYIMYKIF